MALHSVRVLAIVLFLVTAGCNGLPSLDATETTQPPTTAPQTPSDDTQTPNETTTNGGIQYELAIDNEGNDETYNITVWIDRDWGNRSTVYNETITVGADEFVTRDMSFPEAGTSSVAVSVDGGPEKIHPYDVSSPDPESAVVIGIRDDGDVQIATFHR